MKVEALSRGPVSITFTSRMSANDLGMTDATLCLCDIQSWDC